MIEIGKGSKSFFRQKCNGRCIFFSSKANENPFDMFPKEVEFRVGIAQDQRKNNTKPV